RWLDRLGAGFWPSSAAATLIWSGASAKGLCRFGSVYPLPRWNLTLTAFATVPLRPTLTNSSRCWKRIRPATVTELSEPAEATFLEANPGVLKKVSGLLRSPPYVSNLMLPPRERVELTYVPSARLSLRNVI